MNRMATEEIFLSIIINLTDIYDICCILVFTISSNHEMSKSTFIVLQQSPAKILLIPAFLIF